MISEGTARCLVRDGILEKTLEDKCLSQEEKSTIYEQALMDWVDKRRKDKAVARRVKVEKKVVEATEHEPREVPLGA
jgi:hypothetical protein